MQEVRTRLGENGRVVIPAEFRKLLGLKVGDPMVVRRDEAVRAAQRMIRERVLKSELLTERLFSMRRAETRDD